MTSLRVSIRIVPVILVTIVSFCLIAGCAGPVPKRIDISPALLSNITSVTIVEPPEIKTYAVINLGHPGRALGLFGGLFAQADKQEMEAKLTEVLRRQNISIPSALVESVAADLADAGFKTRIERGLWELKSNRYVLPNEKLPVDVDAVLVITPAIVGFVAKGATTDYLPTILSMVTLSDKSRTVIYRGFHATGYEPEEGGWKHTPAKITFTNFAALMASPESTARSLNEAATAIAATIATDLRR